METQTNRRLRLGEEAAYLVDQCWVAGVAAIRCGDDECFAGLAIGGSPLIPDTDDPAQPGDRLLDLIDRCLVCRGQVAIRSGRNDQRRRANIGRLKRCGEVGGVLTRGARRQKLRIVRLRHSGEARQEARRSDGEDDPDGDDQPAESNVKTRKSSKQVWRSATGRSRGWQRELGREPWQPREQCQGGCPRHFLRRGRSPWYYCGYADLQ